MAMAELREMHKSAVKNVRKYINAYGNAPWNEKYQGDDVEKYITNFMGSDTIELTATDGKQDTVDSVWKRGHPLFLTFNSFFQYMLLFYLP